ncbi:MAG: hypothetical protein ABSB69_04225 [Solirubrobacteraceae bacterium]|jgi:hypothetical protein
MRAASIDNPRALAERMVAKEQVDSTIPESTMPPYMEMFLAHLRLLIGVPFEYLVPDARLLPDESIRFFYVDRSWTDRLVDGAIAVGKSGTREQAHHQAHSADVKAQLDLTERVVRTLQRGLSAPREREETPAQITTGFLLRSAAVSGWPSMDVRAFSEIVPAAPSNVDDPAFAQWTTSAEAVQLRTLRLELLSPSVLLALFDGIPKLVWCEEPHHGIEFGITMKDGSPFFLDRHEASGAGEQGAAPVPVPVRAANPRVVAVAQLRKQLAQLNDPKLVPQTGSAGFAIELLQLPWRQRFEGDTSERRHSSGAFVSDYPVASVITQQTVRDAVTELL